MCILGGVQNAGFYLSIRKGKRGLVRRDEGARKQHVISYFSTAIIN